MNVFLLFLDHWNCDCCLVHHWYSTSSKSDLRTFVHCYSGSGDIYGHGVFSQLLAQQRVRYHTVRNLHFLSKNSTLISTENCRFLGGEKLVKMLWFWTF